VGFVLMKREYIKNLIALSCFVMTAGWVVWNFCWIIIVGQSVIGFESYLLNIGELVFALAILVLAIERYIKFIIRTRKCIG